MPIQRVNSRYYTNQSEPSVLNLTTQKTVQYILERFTGDYTIVDLTWFNAYDDSIYKIESDYIIAIDVSDPPYFLPEKLTWIKKIKKPVIVVGSPSSGLPNLVPFLAYLRFRIQKLTHKVSKENFFVSFNGKPHPHRVFYFRRLMSSELKNKGYISFNNYVFKGDYWGSCKQKAIKSDKFEVTADNLVQSEYLINSIDEKQLYSKFEIVCETYPSNEHMFLSEKFNKCVASETPLFLAGCYGSLMALKKYYGFTDFGPDDSYDLLPTYESRVLKMLSIANDFFDYPLESVFDNAKKNAYHLTNNFDAIHDSVTDKYIEKSMKYLKNVCL